MEATKFKVGDMVRVTIANCWIPIGHKARLTEIKVGCLSHRMVGPDSTYYWMSPDHLELVSRQIDKSKIDEVLAKYPDAKNVLKELFPDHSFPPELVSFSGLQKEVKDLSMKAFGESLAMQVADRWADDFPEYKGECLGVSGRFSVELEEGVNSTIIIITKKQTQ